MTLFYDKDQFENIYPLLKYQKNIPHTFEQLENVCMINNVCD